MDKLLKSFQDHPRSVGETYLSHLGSAARFSGLMALGALACLIHGLLPFAFQTTGSRQVRRLYAAMVVDRAGPHTRPAIEPDAGALQAAARGT